MTESNRPPDERWSSDEPTASDPAAPAAPPPAPAAPPPAPVTSSSSATSSASTTGVEPVRRPGMVTAGSITLIVLGALSLLGGVLFMLGGALFAGADSADAGVPPGLEGMAGAFAGMLIFIAILILIYGALEIWAGINALGGRSWARITGIVLSVIGAALFIGGLLGATEEGASPVLNIIFIAAYLFVIFALATGGRWFGARTA